MFAKRVIYAALAASALLLPSAAFAQNWVYVSDTGGGKNWVDRDSISREGDIVTLWVKSEVAEEDRNDVGGPMIRTLEQIDCTKRLIRLVEFVTIDTEGVELDRAKIDSEWFPIADEGFASQKHEMVCKA